MTLGCGGYGGNITSDNISPRHLLNIKRLAYEVTPASSRFEKPSAQVAAAPPGVTADALTRRIDTFLGSRGYRPEVGGNRASMPLSAGGGPSAPSSSTPLEFVCEDDVRAALSAGRTLLISERAIVTPSARDLGEQHRVFTIATISTERG
jgi:acetaldehyde dehydrogenase (acetylating)